MSPRPALAAPAVLSLAACAPPPDFAPRADAARVACGIEALVPLRPETLRPPELDRACVSRLLADLRVDGAQLAAVDGAAPDAVREGTRTAGLVEVSWLLLAADLGDAADLDLAFPTDAPSAGGAVYDYVVGVVTRTEGGTRADLWARMELASRRLEVHRPLAGVFGAGVLLHEARHGELGVGHVPCGFDPQLDCDVTDDGPYDWQAALLQAAADAAVDETLAAGLAADAERYRSRVP